MRWNGRKTAGYLWLVLGVGITTKDSVSPSNEIFAFVMALFGAFILGIEEAE